MTQETETVKVDFSFSEPFLNFFLKNLRMNFLHNLAETIFAINYAVMDAVLLHL